MILYNVTISLDPQIEQDWLSWMQEIHIPEVMATACFINYKICRMLDQEEEGGLTYAIQYLAPSQEAYNTYQEKHAAALQQDHNKRYAGKTAAFRTILSVLKTEDYPTT